MSLTTISPSSTPLKSSSVIWKDTQGAFRVVEGRNPKPKPLNPARYFGAAPETDRNDSTQQAWWCPETETPQAGNPSFEGLLGQTHMIELTGLLRKSRLPQGQVRIVAKTEFISPGMSLNDREVKLKIDRAEACGALRQGMSVVEALKAYGVRLVVGGDLSPELEATRLCGQNPKLFFNLDQFERDSDDAAYLTLGPEIWDQTNGTITHWVCHASKSISGADRFLRNEIRILKLVDVFLENQCFKNFVKLMLVNLRINQTQLGRMLKSLIQDALLTCIRLCREEGIMGGALSGLNVCAALQVASQVDTPSIIVTVLPDIGIKFLSTIFNNEWIESKNLLTPPPVSIPGCLDLNCAGCSLGRVCPRAPSTPSPSALKLKRQRSTQSTLAGGGRGYKRYEDLIGTTPLIDLSHLIDQSLCRFPEQVKVLAKCEFFNPGFSLKDRIARNILDRAESAGLLKPGMCVVAASSGNTGAATAMLCAMRGYSCVITTCPKCSKEKQDAIKAYGAHLFVTQAGLSEDSPDHYMNVARRLVKQNPGLFYDVDQYDTLSNPEGHYLTLGPEIYEQSQCEVTHFICAGSTGGTISGVGKFLKERNPKVKVVLADPIGSVFTNYFLSGNVGKAGKYLVEGVGKGSIPGAMDFSLVDAVLPVTDADAFATCSRLCREEGIWPGGSAGLNVFAALRLAETVEEPCTIVTVMPDLGVKYLTKIYNDEWLRVNRLSVQPPVHVDGLAPVRF